MKHERSFMVLSFITGLLMFSAMFVPVSVSQNPVDEVNGTPPGWSDEINLSETTQNHLETSLAVYQENVHVVWRYNPGPTRDILYRKSMDGGLTWDPFITLGSSPFVAHLPDIDLFENNIHVVWADDDGWNGIYYRNSTDNGEMWNAQRRITPDGIDAYTPQIFVNHSNIHIIWGDLRDGSDGEIYYRRSLDGGITFDNGQGVDEDRRITFSSATIGGIRMAGDNSNISVVWYDERNGVWEIYWAISKDNGFTWEDGLGNVNQDRRLTFTGAANPTVAVNGSNIHIVYVDEVTASEYYLYYINSTDNGFTWNPRQLLAGPVPSINSPDIDVVGENVHVVWDDNRDDGTHHEIYYKNSTDGGNHWSSEVRLTFNTTEWSFWPRIKVQNEEKHVVWHDWYGSNNRDVIYKCSPDFPSDPTYNITLDQGWNLVSLPLEQQDESIDLALVSLAGKWDCIRTYDSLSGTWKTNITGRPDQLNDFDSLNHKQGFWINITEPGGTILTISGYDPPSTSIPLYAGWNLVGYPSLTNETVANSLWGTGADNVMVCNMTEPYQIKEVGPSYVMKPGEGYWVHVPMDTIWFVDW